MSQRNKGSVVERKKSKEVLGEVFVASFSNSSFHNTLAFTRKDQDKLDAGDKKLD